jgi:NitT/TauT family transport system permease protein
MSSRARDWMDFGAVLLALVAFWQMLSWYAGGSTLAPPSTTLATLLDQFQRRPFWDHVQATMEALLLSLLIGLAGGLLIGIVFGLSRRTGVIAEPILASLYSLPKITLYPLVLLIFGLGISAKVVYGVMHGIIPVIMIVMVSIRQIKPVYQRTARVMRLSRWDVVRTIVIPATLPDLLSALRLGFSLSLLGVLIGEMFASKRGLGFLVMNAVEFNNVPLILSVVILLFVFAMSINGVLLHLAQLTSRR